MTAHLVRTEFFSSEMQAAPIPVEYVMKLMFHHRQASALVLFSHGQRRLDGTLHLEPKSIPADDARNAATNVLGGSGSFAINLPGVNAQRIVFRGSIEVDASQKFQRLELTSSLHEARQSGPGLTLFLEGNPGRDEWHYVLKQAGTVVREDTGPISKLLVAMDPHIPGFDLAGIEQMRRQQMAVTQVTAHRGSLRLGSEEIETYVVSLRQGETSACTIHFNQLGQVLAIKTFTGYDLYEEGVAP